MNNDDLDTRLTMSTSKDNPNGGAKCSSGKNSVSADNGVFRANKADIMSRILNKTKTPCSTRRDISNLEDIPKHTIKETDIVVAQKRHSCVIETAARPVLKNMTAPPPSQLRFIIAPVMQEQIGE